jgi:hypothetical protein
MALPTEREISFNGDFAVLARHNVTPGGWHIGFLCPHCQLHFVVMEDPTDSCALVISGAASIRATCPSREQGREYSVADMVVFEQGARPRRHEGIQRPVCCEARQVIGAI